MVIVAPAVALVAFKRGLSPELTQTRMLADQVQLAWGAMTREPLRYVGGNADLAYGVVTYAHDRPQALPGLPERPPARLRSSGASLVCEGTDDGCIAQSSRIAALNPASRTTKIELVRNYWGIPGQPQRYVIFLVPPSADRKSPPV